MTTRWSHRFEVPVRYGIRRARGTADLEQIVTIDGRGQSIELWDPALGAPPRPRRTVEGDLLKGVPSADGRSVILLRDSGAPGSELGHAWLVSLDGSADDVDLTPRLPDYSLRGVDVTADGRVAALTTASRDGFELWIVDLTASAEPRRIYRSPVEAWNGRISSDGTLASIDTTDHLPGARRWAVTVIDVNRAEIVDALYDPPAGTARSIRFSPVDADERLLAVSEKDGFARPVIWDARQRQTTFFELRGFTGDVHPLDWSPDGSRLLAACVDRSGHQLIEVTVATGDAAPLLHPPGSVFEPDTASPLLYERASHYAADGTVRVVVERYDQPLEVWSAAAGREPVLILPGVAPASGTRFRAHTVTAADGVHSQLWLGSPEGEGPFPLILEVHGGPTLVTTDHFDPVAQAWVDEGFAFASLNYRGSVTFGREFREAFVGNPGPGELSDIKAAVESLMALGITQPGQVFITGASYGGFLTLLSLGRMPELFSGGMAQVPMADWAIAYDDMSPALQGAITWFFGGRPDEVPDRYRRASPLEAVGGVRAPVWISAARHDTRTPARQVEAYIGALRSQGGDVVEEWYDGGHLTISLDALVKIQSTKINLARRALRGGRWSRTEQEVT